MNDKDEPKTNFIGALDAWLCAVSVSAHNDGAPFSDPALTPMDAWARIYRLVNQVFYRAFHDRHFPSRNVEGQIVIPSNEFMEWLLGEHYSAWARRRNQS